MQQAKFQVDYDGSAEFHGTSINREILTDPDLLELLLHIITCVRLRKYAVIANLKECFFQIGILPEQRDLFRILWFAEDDLEQVIEIWHFTVYVWGVALNPFIAACCIHQVENDN